MRKTKIFYGNQYVTAFECDGKDDSITKQIVRAYKKYISIAFVLVICAWLVTSGILIAKATQNTKIAYAEVIREVPVEIIPPVMERIAKCESGASHYKNGQVIFNTNTDRTVDIGYYQINSVHNKQAAKLGYDLTKEDDNKAYAMHLYKTQGTEPWYSSKACWNK